MTHTLCSFYGYMINGSFDNSRISWVAIKLLWILLRNRKNLAYKHYCKLFTNFIDYILHSVNVFFGRSATLSVSALFCLCVECWTIVSGSPSIFAICGFSSCIAIYRQEYELLRDTLYSRDLLHSVREWTNTESRGGPTSGIGGYRMLPEQLRLNSRIMGIVSGACGAVCALWNLSSLFASLSRFKTIFNSFILRVSFTF